MVFRGSVVGVVCAGALLCATAEAQVKTTGTSSAAKVPSAALPDVSPAPSAASSAAPPARSPAPPDEAAPDPTVEQARQAFVLATELANQGQWPEALSAFTRSSELHPHPVTTYNLAYCERALGHYVRAYSLFKRTLVEHQAGTTGTLPPDLLALAKGYLPEAEKRLSHALVKFEAPGATLSVDGAPLEVASAPGDARLVLLAGTRNDRGAEVPAASSFELLVDPGRHLFMISRPGSADRVINESFEAGATRELVLGFEEAKPQPVPAEPERAPAPAQSPDRTWVYVAYGVGAAGVVSASIFGSLALGKHGTLSKDPLCPAHCDPSNQGNIDAMKRDALIADISWGVAAAGAIVGTTLLFTTGSSSSQEKPGAAKVEAYVGPLSVGARGRF